MSATSVVLTALSAGMIFLILCYSVPQLFAGAYGVTDAKDKAEIVDAYRRTFAQIIGGFALVLTFAWTFLKDSETLDQGKRQLANQQFVEAAKLLKEDGTSIGGVFALEQVASIRPEMTVPVVNTLLSFITTGRDLKWDKFRPIPIPADAPVTVPASVQAAVFVLTRRNPDRDVAPIDLRNAYLVRAKFSPPDGGSKAAFRGATFAGATLYGADFHGLDLSGARFNGSRMADWEAYGPSWTDETPKLLWYIDSADNFITTFEGAKLAQAGFDFVWMGGVNFSSADLSGAKFWSADLSRADFTDATLAGAHFYEATLTDAVFKGTDVGGINFSKAKLHGTDFRGAKNVGNANFECACADRPVLFDSGVSLEIPACTVVVKMNQCK